MQPILPTEILIASNNTGKVAELRGLMRKLPLQFKYLRDFSKIEDVEETGSTFEENAILKASEYARRTGMWTIADDSGLEIDALDGRPGVFSARYGGDRLSFVEKMQLILSEMEKSANHSRRARFICVMAVADETGQILFTAEGTCAGEIAESPRGTGGFGYDPIFVPEGFTHTFGELSDAIKQQISHRGRACVLIMRYLLHFNTI